MARNLLLMFSLSWLSLVLAVEQIPKETTIFGSDAPPGLDAPAIPPPTAADTNAPPVWLQPNAMEGSGTNGGLAEATNTAPLVAVTNAPIDVAVLATNQAKQNVADTNVVASGDATSEMDVAAQPDETTPAPEGESDAEAAEQPPVQVWADTSLRYALDDTTRAYAEIYNDANVALNFAPSGILREKIVAGGAEMDVFIAASPDEIQTLSEGDLMIPETVRVLAQNQIVMVSAWPSEDDRPWFEMARLDWDKIAIASENTSMSGVAARRMFKNAELDELLTGRLEVHPSSDTVVRALQRARVNAAVIYESDISLLRPPETFRVYPVGATNYPEIVYTGVVLRRSKNVEGATKLLDFLAAREISPIWRRWGFEIPKYARAPRSRIELPTSDEPPKPQN